MHKDFVATLLPCRDYVCMHHMPNRTIGHVMHKDFVATGQYSGDKVIEFFITSELLLHFKISTMRSVNQQKKTTLASLIKVTVTTNKVNVPNSI